MLGLAGWVLGADESEFAQSDFNETVFGGSAVLGRAIKRVIDVESLSRREAQVTLCCAQGLTNAEIGIRLQVSEQTVKFHLRNIFVKFGVKRRTELVSRLFRDNGTDFSL